MEMIHAGGNVWYLPVPSLGDVYKTNIVLVRGETPETTFLIDSGDYPEAIDEFLVPALAGIGLDIRNAGWLLCSHSHGDHIHGHARICELFRGKIACGIRSANRIGVPVDRVVGDGETINGRLRMIAPPGHADDAVCWLDPESNTMICGDSVQGSGVPGCALALLTDPDAYRESMEKLLEIRPDTLVCGHAFDPCGPVIHRSPAVTAFINTSLSTMDRYIRFIQDRPDMPVGELTDQLVERENRSLERYIANGESTVRAIRRNASERRGAE